MKFESVCVFCGSNFGADPAYLQGARALGSLLAERGIELVYGGGNVGLMGAVADVVMQSGGHVTGVIPRGLADRELAHHGISELHIVDTMHERKALMAERSQAFIALPGGMGTFEELLEMLTWNQLGIHAKPCGLLNIASYWEPLLTMLDHAVEQEFYKAKYRASALVAREPETLLARMGQWVPDQGVH
ncbi:MAG: hypothetical protein ACI8TX_000521 [Hyphomicrobiaceae bacterium]|jgi:uncharacterized protein (TIGR00730 family)